MKILMTDKKIISFYFNEQNKVVNKNIKEVMVSIHDKFSIISQPNLHTKIAAKHSLQETAVAVGGFKDACLEENSSKEEDIVSVKERYSVQEK